MRTNLPTGRAALLGLMLALFCWGGSLSPGRTVIVHVDTPPPVWSSSTLETKLIKLLSRSSNGNFMTAQKASLDQPEIPGDLYNLDNLVNWGKEVGGNYLLIVDINSERLQKTKSFHLPLVFHKYETVGVAEGELRVIDIGRGRLLVAEPFKVEEKGPRIFQATMDDNINDPDIHLTAPDKIRFFDRLEEKLASRLVKRVSKVMRLR